MNQRLLKKIKPAFTLAEALIVLGIIGIVAVLIWGVLKGYMATQYLTSAKNMYSDFLKAYEAVEKDIGSVNNWDMLSGGAGANNFFVVNFAPEMRIAKICYQGDSSCNQYELPQPTGLTFLMSNGSTYNFMTYGGRNFWVIEMDTNGVKKPNALGIDKFFFAINNHGLDSISDSPYKDKQGLIIPGLETDTPACSRQTPGSFAHWNLVINGGAPSNECLAVLLKSNWNESTYPIKDYSEGF